MQQTPTTIRMIPPPVAVTTFANGRKYVGVPGVAQDVPYADAMILDGANWVPLDMGGSGTTAQRPTGLGPQDIGLEYSDTTLGYSIVFDGAGWRNFSGAAV